jgi:sulfur-carrier protein
LSVRLLLFASAREAAGRAADEFPPSTLGELLDGARARYGASFAEVLDCARVWLNGDEPSMGDETFVNDGDEVAVIPPVSGG